MNPRWLALADRIDAINRQAARLGRWALLLMLALGTWNVVGRYVGLAVGRNLSSNALIEGQWYLFDTLFLLALGYALQRDDHVRVDVLYSHYSSKLRLWLDLIGGLVFLLPVTIIIGWLAWPMFHNSFLQNEISSNAGGLLRWPIKLMIPLGFWLLTLQGISEIIKRIAMLTGHLTADVHYERPLQ